MDCFYFKIYLCVRIYQYLEKISNITKVQSKNWEELKASKGFYSKNEF